MPSKPHRPTYNLRVHSRTSSIPKIPNIPNPLKQSKKPDSTQRVTSPHPSSSQQQQQQQQQQRDPSGSSRKSPPTLNGTKSKANFTLAARTSTGTDDEWVSAESGAATPNHTESDDDSQSSQEAPTPVEPNRTQASRTSSQPQRTTTNALPHPPIVTSDAPKETHTGETADRSARTSRPNGAEIKGDAASIHTTQRPPSTHSASSMHVSGHPGLRLHPLIRGQSLGPTPTATPAPPTPTFAPARFTSSPPPMGSPTSLKVSSYSPPSPSLHAPLPPIRRRSASSLNSTATSAPSEKHRTPSTVTHSSSITVLSAFAGAGAAQPITRPSTPQRVVHFPDRSRSPPSSGTEPPQTHVLLPAPYVGPHQTVLAHRAPLRESYERVIRAKGSR